MIVIFTDLDGTLLEYGNYTWQRAGGALQHVRETRVPLVFCSSKTLQEQRAYQDELDLDEPMIVEMGSAVVVPEGYVSDEVLEMVTADETAGLSAGALAPELDTVARWRVLRLGRPYAEIRDAVEAVRAETGLPVRGFTEMALPELMERTGLAEAPAMRAQSRAYSETVILDDADEEAWSRLQRAFGERDLALLGASPTGTVVDGRCDKGRAVRLVTELFRKTAGEEAVETVGLGDGPDDLPMLREVDRPILVERRGGGWLDVDLPNLKKVPGEGPRGWDRAVKELLDAPTPSPPRA